MQIRNSIVVFLGFAILASLIFGLVFRQTFSSSHPMTIPLLLIVGVFATWKGKYAVSISFQELFLAACMAGFSIILSMARPPGDRPVWALLLTVSALIFALLGTTIPTLYSRNDDSWKGRKKAK
jgi:hypothetical protein